MVPAILRLLAELAASVVSPPRCAACSAHVPMGRVFCGPCAQTVVVAPESGGLGDAPYLYGGALAQAIVAFKYGGRADLARPLGALLMHGLPRLGGFVPDLVVPVPLHGARLVERGFNQAALLARPLARRLGAPFSPRALARVRDTGRQAALDRAERLDNVEGAFVVRRAISAAVRVLVVDDVRTTGATLRACEQALRAAGAREVRALVLAHAL